MKKISVLTTLFAICAVSSSLSFATENHIQTQYYQLPAGITKLNCMMTINFSNGVEFGPLPVVIDNTPTYIDNGVVEYLCNNEKCTWLEASYQDCDQPGVSVPKVFRTTLSYDFAKKQYTATPDKVIYKFQKTS